MRQRLQDSGVAAESHQHPHGRTSSEVQGVRRRVHHIRGTRAARAVPSHV